MRPQILSKVVPSRSDHLIRGNLGSPRYISRERGILAYTSSSKPIDMAPILGKRKKRNELSIDTSGTDTSSPERNLEHLQDFFRTHFEATFEPIENTRVQSASAAVDAQVCNEGKSDWEGLSGEENSPDTAVTIMEHGKPTKRGEREEFRRGNLGGFMVRYTVKTPCTHRRADSVTQTTRPPSSLDQPLSAARKKQPDISRLDHAVTDAADIKKDLALQRLLKESHLLDSHSSLSHVGSKRHKALDLRLLDLGSKTSILTQQKMPLAHRKGIATKRSEKEEGRRREAKENGVILEKAVKSTKGFKARRERGLGAPSVGKFKCGMLKLSQRDVADIVGPKKPSNGKGR